MLLLLPWKGAKYRPRPAAGHLAAGESYLVLGGYQGAGENEGKGKRRTKNEESKRFCMSVQVVVLVFCSPAVSVSVVFYTPAPDKTEYY